MAVQFGATTYTSLAKTMTKAILARTPISRTLKGHLPEDRKVFEASLDLDPEGKNDSVVIRGASESPAGPHGKGYRETIQVRDSKGKVLPNLRDVLRNAFVRAKEGQLAALPEYGQYLGENIQRILSQTLVKTIQQNLRKVSLNSLLKGYQKMDEDFSKATESTKSNLAKFLDSENQRLDRALSEGRLNDSQRQQYAQMLTSVASEVTTNLNPTLDINQSDLTKISRQFESGNINRETFFNTKLERLGIARQRLAAFTLPAAAE